ncbi:type II secretion system F family protein [Undibacterium sp. RTI2.1]|uniref:type II secretion system F family protein n=1 Tax=unclassified Undibacterium TaxID=2630295 RepID=UPI002AB369FF|nr:MULTISPECIES: type II secretion system F family protein [unclassified Undibacterium]MDY7539948.1 type II secretion system F family protein [Undibacterium sp. 5I1]MEB0032805.1 type II secretion system F family protein [Undibacterium sp. RTI2.1]MEB0116459.1 type II secretion system F family protein [Undibacterium sp. RTI2.2]MEB0230555.1 type II secretion system F family protein [Undibacterium sp. 10I3]MEB0257253.1 type II secretion system F family protein [Undibacterium sp. 5I1]
MAYRYEASSGSGKLVEGQIEAPSEAEAMRLLKQQGLTPIALEAIATTLAKQAKNRRSVSAQDKILMVRELATLLAAGVPLAEAIQSMGEASGGSPVGVAATKVYQALRSGGKLSTALLDSSIEFPDYLIQLVSAGEMTGKLASSLHHAADQMEYEQKVRQEMRNALTYPGVLVSSGILATLLIFIVVVPKFAGLLKNSKGKLPEISVWVLQTGLFVKDNLLLLVIVAGAAIALVVSVLSRPAIRQKLWDGLSRMPLIGSWLVETEIGRWAGMLSTLLENKVPIIKAMELAQGGVQISLLKQQLGLAVKDLKGGKSLADALGLHRTLNPMGLNLVRVGERTGELSTTLKTLSTLHTNAGHERMKHFLILLEPITILLIGSVIGLIMAAIMMAITSLSDIAV